MYKLIVADDERLVREGMTSIIDWEALGIKVVGTAEDGTSALEMISSLNADICVIDIAMPGLSGLDVIAAASEQGLHTRFVILSGYRDFDYARRAIRHSVVAYLEKPVDDDELAEAAARIVRDLGDTHARELDRERAHRTRLYGRLIARPDSPVGDRLAVIAEIEARRFTQSRYQLVRVYIPFSEIPALSQWLTEADRGLIIDDSDGVTLLMDRYYYGASESAAADSLFGSFCQTHNLTVDVVCGRIVTGLAEIPRAYEELRDLAERRFFTLKRGVVFEQDLVHMTAAETPGTEFDGASLLMTQATEHGEYDYLRTLLVEQARRDESVEAAKGRIARLTVATLDSLREHHGHVRVTEEQRARLLSQIYRSSRLGEATNLVVAALRRHFPVSELSGGNLLYRKTLRIIDTHYCENLKLKDLSRMLNCSSSYLGRLFRAKSGVSFNTYVERLRIERAKELLRGEMRVYAIAEEVGYKDVDYFHEKFRKYAGMAPLEYRRSISDESAE